MGGIAEVLINLGYAVQGSDLKPNSVTSRLLSLGARVMIGHRAENVHGADVVVVSTAVDVNNPEVVQAHAQRIPVVPRAEMLGELMRFRYSIAVAGTHGKTTTTSMVASVLAEGRLDPTFVIGGRLKSAGTHARLGAGRYLVAEADESDASFLHLQAIIAIVTNVDADHLGTHEGDFERYKQSFVDFLHNLPFYGLAVMCMDDRETASLIAHVKRPIVTYGISSEADIRAVNVQRHGLQSTYDVLRAGKPPLSIRLNIPGTHNVLNSLAAIAVATELNVSDEAIQHALENFQGIDRRLQNYGDVQTVNGRITVIDDYGHHPTEIAATLDAIRQGWPQRRIVLAFQPHRYTRTRDLLDEFATVLADVDALIVTDVYPAGESPIKGADAKALCRAIRSHGRVEPVLVRKVDDVANALLPIIHDNDVVVVMGAGNIGSLAGELSTLLAVNDASAPPGGAA
jgi:UDP-N-acetylmuramate--alanine ligase